MNNRWDEYFMRHVYLAASMSKDCSTQIGALICRGGQKGSIISEGFNGFPRRVVDSVQRYEDRATKLDFVVHGEHNAILNAAKYGIPLEGTTMYTNGTPCISCAKSCIQAGISEIVIHLGHEQFLAQRPEWFESCNKSKVILAEAGVKLREWDGFLDVKIKCGGKIIHV